MRSPSGCLVKYIISNIPEMSNLPSPPGQNERIDIMASIRKRGNSYQITVSCGRDTQDRKITRTVTYRPELCTAKGHLKSESTIQKEVATYAADFERKVITGQYTEGESLTFEKYSKKYLTEYAEQYQAPRTLEETRRSIGLFAHDFGYMTLANLNPLFLQEYVNSMQTAKKASGQQGTLSHGTVKRRMSVLSAMLSQAVRWNLISYNPMDRVQIKRTNHGPVTEKPMCFTQQQAEIFLSILDNPLLYQYGSRQRKDHFGNIYSIQEYQASHKICSQLKLFFYLAMFTGCRRGELIALTWTDIDFDASTVSITKSTCRSNGQIITKATKTKGSVRKISVPAAVLSLAKQWKIDQIRYRLTIGSQWCGDDYVFIRWNGLQMGLETPYNAFRRIITNYNEHRAENAPELPQIPLHGLRHTAATLLIGHGVDIRTVSGRLGHANTSTTLNIYAEYLKDLDKTASDKLESILLSSTKYR